MILFSVLSDPTYWDVKPPLPRGRVVAAVRETAEEGHEVILIASEVILRKQSVALIKMLRMYLWWGNINGWELELQHVSLPSGTRY
jgi:hypothetical protein